MNRNPIRFQLAGETLGQHQNPRLGSPISRQRGQRKKPSSGSRHDNVPTLPTPNHSGKKRTKRMHNPQQVDVDNPPPILLRRVEEGPRDSDPRIGNYNVDNPMLGKNVPGQPLPSQAIGNVELKRTPTHVLSRPSSQTKIQVDTKNLGPLLSERESGSPPNPTTGPGNKRKPPTHRSPDVPQKSPPQLPRGHTPTHMLDKLGDKPSNRLSPIPNSPVRSDERPPPKPLTPSVSGPEYGRSNKRIPHKSDLLHRNPNPPPPRPRNPPNHIGPIKLNPITSVPIIGVKPP